MPTDPVGPRGRHGSKDPTNPRWKRLADAKVTPALVLLFFLCLAVISGMAAGIGLVAHHFRAPMTQPR